MQSAARNGHRLTAIRIIAGLAILQLFIALFNAHLTFTHEESMWHYIGRNWIRHGMQPYTGGADNKSPLIFLVFGISDWLFGVNSVFPRILGSIIEMIGVYYLYRIAVHVGSNPAKGRDGHYEGLFVVSIYGFSLLWKMSGGKLVSFTETYATTFVIISFYHCFRANKNRHYFISGLLAGIGFGFRFSALFAIAAISITCLRRSIKAALLFTCGIITACLVLALLAYIAGIHLSDIIHYGITDNFGKGSTTDHSLQWKLESFINNFFESELVLFYPFVFGYIFLKRKFDPLVTWLIFAFIGINLLGIYARPHFKELLPALSLISAMTLADLVYDYKFPFKPLLLIVCICFFPKQIEPFIGLKKWIKGTTATAGHCDPENPQSNEDMEKQLGLWIKANTKPTDLVYVAGFGARVQVYSERISPTTYFNVTQTPSARQQLSKDLINTMPDLIAIPAFENYINYVHEDIRNTVKHVVQDHYRFETCKHGYDIFRLKNVR
jgi:hypothetical protein